MNSIRIASILFAVAALTGCPKAPGPDPLPAAPKIASFKATPSSVKKGEKVTLSWETSDGAQVSIADSVLGAVSGVDDKASGEVSVAVSTESLYVLTVTNSRGVNARAVVSVKIIGGTDSAQVLFTALPEVLGADETGTLVWSASGANSVLITGAGQSVNLMGQTVSGSVSISPTAAETVYTLTADTVSKMVTVKRAPSVLTFTADKNLAKPGDMVVFNFTTKLGTKVVLGQTGRGTLFESTTAVASGTFTDTVSMAANGTVLNYILDVTGPGGTARKNVSLVVGNLPIVTEVTAPEYAKTSSTFALNWKTENADIIQVKLGEAVVFETRDLAKLNTGAAMLTAPLVDATYTLVALSLSAASASKTVSVKPVGALGTPVFTATPNMLADGGTAVVLTYNVSNARKLSINQENLLTVVSKTGTNSEMGTTTVYPNSASSVFTLTATNTVDLPITATATVTVGNVTNLQSAGNAVVFESDTSVGIDLRGGTSIVSTHPNVMGGPGAFDDISMTGKKLTFATPDNAVASLAVEAFETWVFSTKFAGPYSISIDGNMRLLGTAPTGAPPAVFPSTSTLHTNLLAPLFADLQLGMNGAVFWQIKGEAPNQTLIVQWDRMQVGTTATSEVTFQALVNQVGEVKFAYKTLTFPSTVFTLVNGVQGANQASGLVGTPVVGDVVSYYAARMMPLTAVPASFPFSGWVKFGTGYARMTMPAGSVVRNADFGISEVMFSAAPALTAGEYFEVSNFSPYPIDINGWEVDFGMGSTHTITSSTIIPADGGIKVLAQSDMAANNDAINVAYAYGSTFNMIDTAAYVALKRGTSLVFSSAWDGGVGGPGVSIESEVVLGIGGQQRVACSAPTGSTFGTQMPLQRGSPGTRGRCLPLVTTIPVSFNDISTSGTVIPFADSLGPDADEGNADVDVSSAPISIEGQSVNTLRVFANGFILTTTTFTGGGLTNKTAPTTTTPLGTIAPFWDDLDLGTGHSKRIAAGEDVANPTAHWIVQWKNFAHWSSTPTGDIMNFQVKFFDDGIIEYHYATMTSGNTLTFANGNSATVWLENRAGNGARPFSVNQPNITSNMAIRFTP